MNGFAESKNQMDRKVLLVDDDPQILDLLEGALRKEGFHRIHRASTGGNGVELCKSEKPALVVLDVMLPDMDGMEVCRNIRQFSYVPILFLSSRDEEIDKILGLSSGGDDYITKPFSPTEVLHRIKAQLRRIGYGESINNAEEAIIKIQNICIDREAKTVFKGEKEVELTAKEYGVLLLLAENQNKIISMERIYEHVWGQDGFQCENTVMVHIRRLREKIEKDPGAPEMLKTVKGLGYRFVNKAEK